VAYLDANNDFDEINGRLDLYYACMALLSLKCNFGSMNECLKSMFIRLVELCLWNELENYIRM